MGIGGKERSDSPIRIMVPRPMLASLLSQELASNRGSTSGYQVRPDLADA
jgi:hypothetical protein